jgi:hypothetical protein
MALFQGEAKKFTIKITDSAGVVVDPSTVDNIKVWMYEQKTETVIDKWSMVAASGFTAAEASTNTEGEPVMVIHLDDSKTAVAPSGKAVIQVTVYDKYPDGKDLICTKKGIYAITREAMS